MILRIPNFKILFWYTMQFLAAPYMPIRGWCHVKGGQNGLVYLVFKVEMFGKQRLIFEYCMSPAQAKNLGTGIADTAQALGNSREYNLDQVTERIRDGWSQQSNS